MAADRKSKSKNKKIICFIDETGTPGSEDFSLGLAMAFATDVSKIDKIFSDLLPVNFNEFHANKHDNNFVKSKIQDFSERTADTSLRLFSHYKPDLRVLCPQTTYARSLIEAVKAASKSFRKAHRTIGPQINNIDVIVDSCEHNTGAIFRGLIESAKKEDGLFRGVNSVTPLDSSISRMIQLADAIAYLRHLSSRGEISARELDKELRILLF